MFPRGALIMDITLSSSAKKFTDPANELFSRVGDQLAVLPDITVSSPRAKTSVKPIGETDGAVKRPNGEYYVPRKVKAGDVTLDDVKMMQKAYEKRIPTLLYGPPGTGKTALAEAALENLITLSGHGDTEMSDFEGSWVQNPDGTYSWVDGPWVVAMENGWPLLVDEIALIDAKVLAGVYPSMDGRKKINIRSNPARGEINIKDGFYVVGACNPDVPGAVMSEALLSRFLLHVEVLTDFDLAVRLGVNKEIVVVARNLTRKQTAGEVLRAPQMRELLGFKTIVDTFGLQPALANFISIAEPGDRDAYAEAVKSAFGKTVSTLKIQ